MSNFEKILDSGEDSIGVPLSSMLRNTSIHSTGIDYSETVSKWNRHSDNESWLSVVSEVNSVYEWCIYDAIVEMR